VHLVGAEGREQLLGEGKVDAARVLDGERDEREAPQGGQCLCSGGCTTGEVDAVGIDALRTALELS
jgi:hypothetical protein